MARDFERFLQLTKFASRRYSVMPQLGLGLSFWRLSRVLDNLHGQTLIVTPLTPG